MVRKEKSTSIDNSAQNGWQMIINSNESLYQVADYCHDQYFNLDDLTFDEKRGVFSLDVWRVLYEESKCIKDYILFQVYLAPVIKSGLIFKDSLDLRVLDAEPDDIITDITYNSKENEIFIECGKTTKIYLKVKNLKGEFRNTTNKFIDAFKYRTYLYWMEVSGSPWDIRERYIEEKELLQETHKRKVT